MVDTDMDAQQSLLSHDMIRIACKRSQRKGTMIMRGLESQQLEITMCRVNLRKIYQNQVKSGTR